MVLIPIYTTRFGRFSQMHMIRLCILLCLCLYRFRFNSENLSARGQPLMYVRLLMSMMVWTQMYVALSILQVCLSIASSGWCSGKQFALDFSLCFQPKGKKKSNEKQTENLFDSSMFLHTSRAQGNLPGEAQKHLEARQLLNMLSSSL